MRRNALAIALLLGLLPLTAVAAQETYVLILLGLGGDEEHSDRFHEWGGRVYDAAMEAGVAAERIRVLAEAVDRDPARIAGRSTKEGVEAAIAEIAKSAQPEDQVWVIAIGHGSASDGTARFNLPGPDMTAADFARALESVRARVAFVNAASSSGGFVVELSEAGRAVVTATKTAGQRNETIFAEFFTNALAGGGADLDKNGRVSLLEAFDYARQEVAKHYEEKGLLATENPLLDDNGDGVGTLLPPLVGHSGAEEDGLVASRIYFGGVDREAAAATASPELAALASDRLRLERRVEELRLQKNSLDEEVYLQELERLLVELAVVEEAIRELETAGEGDENSAMPRVDSLEGGC